MRRQGVALTSLDRRLVMFGRLQREGIDPETLLQDRGFRVYAVHSEDELLDIVAYSPPDVVLLIGQVDLHSVSRLVAASQRTGSQIIVAMWPGVPVPIAVDLLDMGVDYVTGTLQPDWLMAQLRACLRRFGRERSAPQIIDLEHLRIDLQQRVVTVSEHEISLTPTEFSVLRILAERPGTVLPAGEIMQHVMGGRISESEAQDLLKVHIHRLRQKLEVGDGSRQFIRTVRGHGYMYAFERRLRDREAEAPEL